MFCVYQIFVDSLMFEQQRCFGKPSLPPPKWRRLPPLSATWRQHSHSKLQLICGTGHHFGRKLTAQEWLLAQQRRLVDSRWRSIGRESDPLFPSDAKDECLHDPDWWEIWQNYSLHRLINNKYVDLLTCLIDDEIAKVCGSYCWFWMRAPLDCEMSN